MRCVTKKKLKTYAQTGIMHGEGGLRLRFCVRVQVSYTIYYPHDPYNSADFADMTFPQYLTIRSLSILVSVTYAFILKAVLES